MAIAFKSLEIAVVRVARNQKDVPRVRTARKGTLKVEVMMASN